MYRIKLSWLWTEGEKHKTELILLSELSQGHVRIDLMKKKTIYKPLLIL